MLESKQLTFKIPFVVGLMLTTLLGAFCASTVVECGREGEVESVEFEETLTRGRDENQAACESTRISFRQRTLPKLASVRRQNCPQIPCTEHSARNGIGRPLTT